MLYLSLQLNASDYDSRTHKKLKGKGKSMLCNLEPTQNCPDKNQTNWTGSETATKLFLLPTWIRRLNKNEVFGCYNDFLRIKLSKKAFLAMKLYIQAT